MASPDKQKKRAQRAKTKARQNRMGKTRAKGGLLHPVLADPLIDEPFDDIEFDLSTFDFQDIEENGFDPALFDELFVRMQYAERTSLLALCLVFLQYPVLELVVAEESQDSATDFIMALLIAYRAFFHDEDEDAAIAWISSEAFQSAYNEASLLLQQRSTRGA